MARRRDAIGADKLARLADRHRVTDGDGFRLSDHDPDERGAGHIDKDDATALLREGVERLSELQELLYPSRTWAVLAVLQGMDTAGKDGIIKHVLSGVNPQGVRVSTFRPPSEEELRQDFLRRVATRLPERGQIGIFNRSHYEEVLVVRVHPDLLSAQHLPTAETGPDLWRHRLADIAAYETYLARQGFVILKFFLHISKQEQRKRLLARLDDPAKRWKFTRNDVAERAHWDAYQHVYEQAIAATAAPHAPWIVVPANRKWFARLIVVETMIAALTALNLSRPSNLIGDEAVYETARAALQDEN